MPSRKTLPKNLPYPLFAAVSLMIGLSIPAFYDWTGSDQSRLSPIIKGTAIGLVVFAVVSSFVVAWSKFRGDQNPLNPNRNRQFGIRSVLTFTALTAFFFAAASWIPESLIGGATIAILLIAVSRSWIQNPHDRWRMSALIAAMYFPFAWIVSADWFFDHWPTTITMVPGLPGLFPTLLVSGLVDRHFDNLSWVSSSFTIVELMIGLWIIHRPGRVAIVYQLWVLILSTFGSFCINAMARM